MNISPIHSIIDLYKEEFDINLDEDKAVDEFKDLLYIYAFSEGKFHLLNKITALSKEELLYYKKSLN